MENNSNNTNNKDTKTDITETNRQPFSPIIHNSQVSEATPSKHGSSRKDILSEAPKQTYFTCCGRTRRCPSGDDMYGVVIMITCFAICSAFFETICFSLSTTTDPFLLSRTNQPFFLSIGIISLAMLIVSLYAYLNIVTSLPGYQLEPKMTKEEFLVQQPTLTIGKVTFLLKYCETCHIVRNVRSFHCRLCNKCVERHDHHCGFVSNCIGRDNNNLFFWFLRLNLWLRLRCIIFCTSNNFKS